MAGKSQSGNRGTKAVHSAVRVFLVAAGAAWLLAMSGCSAKVSGKTASDRKAAVCDIAENQPSGAVEALVLTIQEDQDADVRQVAVVGLGRFNTPEARQAVERALADPSPKVRAAAAGTLGLFGDSAAADRLGALAVSVNLTLAERKASVLGLARCESQRSIVWLLDTAENADDPEVKLVALCGLYKKLGLRYLGGSSATTSQWLEYIELTKDFPEVQSAYAQAGRALERHPENKPKPHNHQPVPVPLTTSAPGGK